MKINFYFLVALIRLGFFNLLRVARYRLGLRLGTNPAVRLEGRFLVGPFFSVSQVVSNFEARNAWLTHREAFGLFGEPFSDTVPDWHKSVITGKSLPPDVPWHHISDFGSNVGDIKGIWEASRFDWVLSFSQQALTGNVQAFERLNIWLTDWCSNNQPYTGSNWKCGQEASIRVMHLTMAAYILDEIEHPQPALIQMIIVHLRRIAPTILYAVAQDNNHGTSEAAALFIGGSWLSRLGITEGRAYRETGLKWLENRAKRLIMPDGSFSQYSLNYHRMMLDTYSWTEVWRELMGESEFSDLLYERLRAATLWLANMLAGARGEMPNLGANDGARLIPLADTDYRDYRPSVQLAAAVFHRAAAYSSPGCYDLPLQWLGIQKPEKQLETLCSKEYPNGGFVVIRNARTMLLFRYPAFRFRPGQCDLLHIDLWHGDNNLLRDAGSYSYNSDDEWADYFASCEAHNTIQFDGLDQMPRIGRFLYGAWPKAHWLVHLNKQDDVWYCQAGYRNWLGAVHVRKIKLGASALCVEDHIWGFKEKAVLRWRLCPGEWQLTADGVVGPMAEIKVSAGDVPLQISLVEGQESLYYSQRTPLPVLEVAISLPGVITSEIFLLS